MQFVKLVGKHFMCLFRKVCLESFIRYMQKRDCWKKYEHFVNALTISNNGRLKTTRNVCVAIVSIIKIKRLIYGNRRKAKKILGVILSNVPMKKTIMIRYKHKKHFFMIQCRSLTCA